VVWRNSAKYSRAPASAANQNILATTGDYLRLWDLKQETDHLPKLSCKSTLANIRRGPHKKDYCAPLTSFDWNETDPSLCVTSSIDTTCTVWNVETGQAKTQLIAHDKEVFDVAFAKGTDVFASVGADGSVRMFDLRYVCTCIYSSRSLEHSTIIYETSAAAKALTTPAGGPAGVDTNIQTALQSPHEQSPLLRLAWNKQDPNYLATFQLNSKSVLILDIRVPATPVCTLTGHGGVVNAVAWAPHSAGHLVSVGDDHQALVWDVEGARVRGEGEPVLAYNAGGEINQVSWNAMLSDWIGISTGNFISVLKV
jgi:WD repeat-containing protein 68